MAKYYIDLSKSDEKIIRQFSEIGKIEIWPFQQVASLIIPDNISMDILPLAVYLTEAEFNDKFKAEEPE